MKKSVKALASIGVSVAMLTGVGVTASARESQPQQPVAVSAESRAELERSTREAIRQATGQAPAPLTAERAEAFPAVILAVARVIAQWGARTYAALVTAAKTSYAAFVSAFNALPAPLRWAIEAIGAFELVTLYQFFRGQ